MNAFKVILSFIDPLHSRLNESHNVNKKTQNIQWNDSFGFPLNLARWRCELWNEINCKLSRPVTLHWPRLSICWNVGFALQSVGWKSGVCGWMWWDSLHHIIGHGILSFTCAESRLGLFFQSLFLFFSLSLGIGSMETTAWPTCGSYGCVPWIRPL